MPMLTLLMVFLTTTSVSCTSVDFSLRADADAKTLSLERNWLRVDSASSARFSADSSSRWNFFTLMMFELEMDSCSSSCLLYILIFSFSLSRESWRMMMFFLSSSDCRMSSLMLLVLVCSSVMVTEWDFFSLLIITSSSSIRTSIFWMVLLLVATELVSISSILTLRLLTTDLHLLDGSLAGGHRVGLNLLNPDTEAPHFVLQRLLCLVDLHKLGLLLPEEGLKVVCVRSSLVGAVICQLQLSGNVVVVLGHLPELLLQLCLHHHQLVVGAGQLVHLSVESVQFKLVILDGSQRLVVVGCDLLVGNIQLSQLLDGHIILLHAGTKLPVHILVGGCQLHDLLVLHLAGVLQLGVALVGGIQRHLELSDGDRHLLLDHLNLILQPGLGLSKPPAKNVDLVHQLLLVRLILASCSTESFLKLGLQLGNLLLQELHLVHSLCLLVVRLLVSPGQFLSLVNHLPVVAVQIGEPLLQGIHLSLEGLQLILQLGLHLGEALVGHLDAVHLVAHLDNILGAGLGVAVSLLVKVGHLLQFDC